MKKLTVPILAIALAALAAPAMAQEHYNEGSVWRVNYLNTKPGKFGDAQKDIREHFAKVYADAKAQGVVLDYKVFLNATSTGPNDWNIATAVLYKGYSALDGLAGKMDAITLKHYGSAEARTQAGAKRAELWTTVSSALAREISMKP
ncbi:MAG: hypothetical protein M3167_13655 [Acidobacteriota bacterium]|nr:hypothetical protein [Acidobacteriota bacterium]